MPLSSRQIAVTGGTGAVALLAFALGWWGGDDGNRRALTITPAPEWEAPKRIASDVSAYSNILAQRSPFGAPAERANAMPAAPAGASPGNAGAAQWRVGGIVTTETSQHLIILIRRPGDNTTRSEMRHAGETLPDGSIIRTVEPTNVTIEREGTIVRIKMFAQN